MRSARLQFGLLAAVLVLAASERGINAQQATAGSASGSPRAVISSTSYDFGNVYRGEVISHVFVIKNVGTADLSVELTSSCGCEVIESDKVVPPGKEGTAMIEINTATQAGQILKVATLRTNDPNLASVSLTLNANVLTGPGGGPVESVQLKPGKYVGPLFVSPQTRWVTSALPGQKAIFEFLISSEKNIVNLKRVETESTQVTARVETLEAGKRFKVVIESIPTSGPGRFDNSFKVFTDSPALPWFPLHLHLRISDRRR